jgi:hypothetical protein
MSDPLRIALVAEGVTDYEVLRASISSMLGDRPFLLHLLQPEASVAFTGTGSAGALGGGWEGVYHWTQSLRDRAGRLSEDVGLFTGYDLFIMHLDADVAAEDPASYRNRPYPELKGALPCQEECPPPSATTDRLRNVMLQWLGETALPPKAVLCTPSRSMEAWVIPICCPHDKEARKPNWECRAHPENRLGQQPKNVRFSKTRSDYQARHDKLKVGWKALTIQLSEAERFQNDFVTTAQTISS